jgi:hypothetical protein
VNSGLQFGCGLLSVLEGVHLGLVQTNLNINFISLNKTILKSLIVLNNSYFLKNESAF